MSSQMSWIEKELTNAVYPAVLKADVRRLLAVKLQEIRDKHNGEKQALYNAQRTSPFINRDSNGNEYLVVEADIDSLPAVVVECVTNITNLREQIRQETEALNELNYLIYESGKVFRRGTKTEVEQLRARAALEQKDLDEKHREELREFYTVVHELSVEQVKKIRNSIPVAIREKLDNLGKGLPSGTTVAELGDGEIVG